METILKLKGFIIDFRYGLREEIRSMVDYLLDNKYPFAKVTGPSNIEPGLFSFIETDNLGRPGTKKYRGKLILLVDEHTQSSGEYNVMAFSSYPQKLVIGSTTSGADGDVTTVTLPGGIVTTFTSLGIYYPDKRETQQIGIIPDVIVRPTLKESKKEEMNF